MITYVSLFNDGSAVKATPRAAKSVTTFDKSADLTIILLSIIDSIFNMTKYTAVKFKSQALF